MADSVGGISGLTRQHLPTYSIDDAGKYLKIDANGNPVYYTETPGGIVTEAGANAANDIGGTAGATTAAKVGALADSVTAHKARHQHGGADEIATATPAANAIPKAGAGGTLAAGFIPQATTSAVGGAELSTSAEVTAGSSATTVITPAALAAGFPHIKKMANAEAYTAMMDYQVAAKMPPALLREIVEAASCGCATVLHDDLGFPSMMYVIRGPILAGHIHADMGSVSALRTAVIAAAGSGYTANDILTIAGGTGGTVRVLTVDGSGAVTSIEITNPGTGYSAATGAATTGGTGTLCTITTTIGPVHPAFMVGGVEKKELLIQMFKGTTFDGSAYHGSGTGARLVSWPGLYPTGSLTYDQFIARINAKGSGWHMMSMWERGLLIHMPMKMGTEPRGNTYYGRSHESGYEYECGVRSDGLAPGTASGIAKHRNGSGPTSWAHNKERWGIHDLSGSIWEWVGGFKEVDGLIYMPNDNNYGLAEASWPSQGVYLDNTTAVSGGAPRLSDTLANVLTDPNYSSVTHNAMTLTAGYDALDLAKRQRMLLAGIAPRIASGGTNPWSPKGTLYNRNYGERLPFCGGDWRSASDAGLSALALHRLRSFADSSFGSRAAFLSP